jgi:hypothetical protein
MKRSLIKEMQKQNTKQNKTNKNQEMRYYLPFCVAHKDERMKEKIIVLLLPEKWS